MLTFVYQEIGTISEDEFNSKKRYYIKDANGNYTEATTYNSQTVYFIKIILVDQVYLEDQNGNYDLLNFSTNILASPQWEEKN